MKIEELNPNPALSNLTVARADKPEAVEAHGGETVVKQHAASDKVELSSYMPVVSAKGRRDARVNRVEELRSEIQAGSYQVSGRAVAEKMLSKIVMSSAR